MIYTPIDSPIGELLLLGDGEVLHGLYMQAGRKPVRIQPRWTRDDGAFAEVRRQLDEYFAGERASFDIGMHLELAIPAGERYHPGETWTPELALPFVIERSKFPADFMASEVDRYLGLPGQAISYKVGERVWLRGRDDARARAGASFDLKDFHRRALDLGPMGLDQLDQELARL